MKIQQRILLSGQSGAQARCFELCRHQVTLHVTELSFSHRRIELDENLAGLHALPIVHMDRANDASLERLYDLGATARNDPARRRGDDIDFAEARPRKS